MPIQLRAAAVFAAMFIALLPSGARAQLLAGADWFEREVAEGVVWRYYNFDDLFGAVQSISYVEADLDDPNIEVVLPYLASSRARTSSMIPSQFPAARTGINGTYFDTSAGGGGSTTYLRIGGAVVNPQSGGAGNTNMRHEGAIAFATADGAVEIIQRPGDADWATNTTHADIMANGPLLQVAGTIPDFSPIGSHCSNRHPRTAVGLTVDNRIILLTVDGRTDFAAGMTCDELAQVMEALGCVDSLNMDGGGSTTLWAVDEPFNGVVNYPSDNGRYDHAGERSCSNAIALVAPAPASTPARDARLSSIDYDDLMTEGELQTVTITYQNIGSETWTSADTWLQVSRPETRTSMFEDFTWLSAQIPAGMTTATVAPGATATFQFVVNAPPVDTATRFVETFQLQGMDGRFGPADNEARLILTVEREIVGGTPEDIIVESKPDGQNYVYYSEVGGFADSNATTSALGCTATGTRYASTFLSIVGPKEAVIAPTMPLGGRYRVYAAWPAAGLRGSPITYNVGFQESPDGTPAGSQAYLIDQTAKANEWVLLGEHYFAQGAGARVGVTNENIDQSGNFYPSAIKFEYAGPVAATNGVTAY